MVMTDDPKMKDANVVPEPIIMFAHYFLILGEIGAGKSTFIDTAGPDIDPKPEIGHGLKSCTAQVSVYKVQDPKNRGAYVRLIDTPGFNDPDSPGDDKQLEIIIDRLEKKSGPNAKLAGIIYLHEINQARLTKNSPVMKSRPFGVVFVTTKWSQDQRQQKIQANLERELKTTFNNVTMIRSDNTLDSAWNIIGTVTSAPAEIPLGELQRKLEHVRRELNGSENKIPKFFQFLISGWPWITCMKHISFKSPCPYRVADGAILYLI
ncbi:hypothetical protein BDZ97DRAFT_1996661 [Flammula alnicola]|nr:hypothetical protein BDZ97DRAFT_1996661 [Flammula alnicola]